MIEKLYKAYFSELIKWCSLMTRDHHLAEELVHEAFLRAMLNEPVLTTLDDKQKRSWLYRTVKNLYIDHIRHSSFETLLEVIPESTYDSEDIKEFEWQTLIDALPDIEGVLFVMRYLQGYNSTQLSEFFSMPSGTIRSKLSSARKHLKEMIGGNKYV